MNSNYKYRLKDLKNRPEDQPLPEDVNESFEVIADRLKDAKLKEALASIRKNHWYGPHYHYGNEGRLVAYFEFCYGVCIRGRLVKYFDDRNAFHMNIINKKVSLKNSGVDDGKEEGRM
jgi:hypothetical protein